MTNGQREAIDRFKYLLNLKYTPFNGGRNVLIDKEAIDTVLFLIKEQQEKIEKYEKIIDKISQDPFNELRVDGIRFCGGDIKQYFERKVEDGN